MKLIFLAMLLFLWVSPMSMTSTDIVIRINQNGFDYVSNIQRELLQKAMSNISFPFPTTTKKKESGGLISRIANNGDIFGSGHSMMDKVMNINNVKIHHVKLPKLNVKLVTGVGLHVSMDVDFKMTGKHAILGDIEIKVRGTGLADIMLSKTPKGDPFLVVTDCKPIIRDMDIKFGLGLLNTIFSLFQRQIREMLCNRLCQLVPSLFEEINEDFDVFTEKHNFGDNLAVRYTLSKKPVVTGGYFERYINAKYTMNKHMIKHLNDDQDFTIPAGLGNKDTMVNLGFSKNYFSCLFTTYQKSRGFDLEIPSTHECLANQMSTSALGAHIPEISSRYPQPLPVDMKIVLSQTPVVTFQNNQLIVQFAPYVEMFVVLPYSPDRYQHLLTINVGASLVAALHVEEEKLKISVSLQGDLKLEFASISFGKCKSKPSLLSEYMRTVFEKAYLPYINEILSVGVPLSTMPNIHYINPVIAIEKNFAAMSFDVRYE
uniref:Bactericidal permeability-increasing protein n=1 Tax=Leptobrachium leishanense TaxID=445787 RepID=A0A8C5R3E8_9ANUR